MTGMCSEKGCLDLVATSNIINESSKEERIRHLLCDIDSIKGNREHCYRLQQQLIILVDVLSDAEERAFDAVRVLFSDVDRALDECNQAVRKTSFPQKNRLKTAERELMRLNTSLLSAVRVNRKKNSHLSASLDSSMHPAQIRPFAIEKNLDANFRANFPKVLKQPEVVESVKVSYSERGDVNISWSCSLTDIVDHYQIMRDHPSDIFPNVSGHCENVNLFYDPIRNFEPFRKYTVRVRAVNSAGQSSWSDGVIVLIKQAPPATPTTAPKLITLFCSSTNSTFGDVDSVRLSVPYPKEEDCNGLPLEKVIVEYSSQYSTDHDYCTVSKFSPEENGQMIVEVKKLDFEKKKYTFAVIWSNAAGDSPASGYVEVSKRDAVPSPPPLVWESSNKTGHSVKIRWAPPKLNAFAVARYEVQRLDSHGVFRPCANSLKCSATVKHLKQRTRYVFRVCAVTASGVPSDYSTLIRIKTKLSAAARETLGGMAAVGGFTFGVVIGPVAGPFLGLGAAAGLGIRMSKLVKNKAGKVATGTSVTLVSALPMAVFGSIASPFIVPVCAADIGRKLVVSQQDFSDQSSDEED